MDTAQLVRPDREILRRRVETGPERRRRCNDCDQYADREQPILDGACAAFIGQEFRKQIAHVHEEILSQRSTACAVQCRMRRHCAIGNVPMPLYERRCSEMLSKPERFSAITPTISRDCAECEG